MPLDMSPTNCGKCVGQEAQGAVVTQQTQSAGSVCLHEYSSERFYAQALCDGKSKLVKTQHKFGTWTIPIPFYKYTPCTEELT